MKILFWNTHGNQNINNYVASLSVDYDVDILILEEYEDNKTDLGNILRERKLIARSTIGCDRIEIWSSYVDVEQGFQDPYYSIQIIKNEYIICCVHLPSDLHGDYSEERFGIIQQMMKEIQKVEEVFEILQEEISLRNQAATLPDNGRNPTHRCESWHPPVWHRATMMSRNSRYATPHSFRAP